MPLAHCKYKRGGVWRLDGGKGWAGSKSFVPASLVLCTHPVDRPSSSDFPSSGCWRWLTYRIEVHMQETFSVVKSRGKLLFCIESSACTGMFLYFGIHCIRSRHLKLMGEKSEFKALKREDVPYHTLSPSLLCCDFFPSGL